MILYAKTPRFLILVLGLIGQAISVSYEWALTIRASYIRYDAELSTTLN